MEIRETENTFVFEVKFEEDAFTFEVPKNVTWQKAKGAACSFYEEITRQEYRSVLVQAEKTLAESKEAEDKPAEEIAAEVVS